MTGPESTEDEQARWRIGERFAEALFEEIKAHDRALPFRVISGSICAPAVGPGCLYSCVTA